MVLNQVDQAWSGIRHAPQTVADKAKEQYDSVTTTISDYLRNTGERKNWKAFSEFDQAV